jgi:hypothetical protein
MIHVAMMKRLIGSPLLIHIEILRRSRSRSPRRSFRNRGVGVGAFVYRLHSPGVSITIMHGMSNTKFETPTLWSLRVHYRSHILQIVPIPSQIPPRPLFVILWATIILLYYLRLRFLTGIFIQAFPSKACTHFSPMRVICPANHCILDHSSGLILGKE